MLTSATIGVGAELFARALQFSGAVRPENASGEDQGFRGVLSALDMANSELALVRVLQSMDSISIALEESNTSDDMNNAIDVIVADLEALLAQLENKTGVVFLETLREPVGSSLKSGAAPALAPNISTTSLPNVRKSLEDFVQTAALTARQMLNQNGSTLAGKLATLEPVSTLALTMTNEGIADKTLPRQGEPADATQTRQDFSSGTPVFEQSLSDQGQRETTIPIRANTQNPSQDLQALVKSTVGLTGKYDNEAVPVENRQSSTSLAEVSLDIDLRLRRRLSVRDTTSPLTAATNGSKGSIAKQIAETSKMSGGSHAGPTENAMSVWNIFLGSRSQFSGEFLLNDDSAVDVSATLGQISPATRSDATQTGSTSFGSLAARPSAFSIAIAEQLRNVQVNDGITRVQLSPKGLGQIEIEVVTEIDNTTHVVIRSENSNVLSALREAREPLAVIMDLNSGGSLNFEDKSMGQGQHEWTASSSNEQERQVSDRDRPLVISAVEADIIDSERLDITT